MGQPGSHATFQPTQWSVVLRAGQTSAPEAAAALEVLCRTYWYPVYAFVRWRGHAPAEAQDLIQGFFADLLDRNWLEGIGPEKGLFHTYLLRCLQHYLINEWHKEHGPKRRPPGGIVPLETDDAELRYVHEVPDDASPDKLFERRWVVDLLDQVNTSLRAECLAAGHQASYDRDLETISLKCLAKTPSRRYPSAAAVAEDLERVLRHEPISARAPTTWERLVNHARLHPVRAALVGLAVLAIAMTAASLYASWRTYHWLMRKAADEHLIVPPRAGGVYTLTLQDYEPPRCTQNFWKEPFWAKRGLKGRYARLEFTNLPLDFVTGLAVQVCADIPAFPDVPKTAPLTNGQVFHLGDSSLYERAFYLRAVNFAVSNIVAQASDAAVRIVLLGRPGDLDPYRKAGTLAPAERE